jgi:hypothetical protein
MMKTNEIIPMTEMTWRAGNLDSTSATFVGKNKDYWYREGKHVGDIDQFAVRKTSTMYTLWDSETIVACANIDVIPGHYAIVDDVWVAPEYRGQKIFSKMLWFFKTRENQPKLVLGDIHSATMQEVVKGLSRFNKHWMNKTGEVKDFSLDTLNDFYSYGGKTGWRLVLENAYDFSDFPRFTDGKSWIRESYDWQIE